MAPVFILSDGLGTHVRIKDFKIKKKKKNSSNRAAEGYDRRISCLLLRSPGLALTNGPNLSKLSAPTQYPPLKFAKQVSPPPLPSPDYHEDVLINICSSRRESESEVAQSGPTLCDTMDCSLPGSSVHGILQARVLEWVAISFSRGSSQPRDQTRVSCIASRCFTAQGREL